MFIKKIIYLFFKIKIIYNCNFFFKIIFITLEGCGKKIINAEKILLFNLWGQYYSLERKYYLIFDMKRK